MYLVGFDAGSIHRPGLSLYLFGTGKMQAEYIEHVRQMLSFTFTAHSHINTNNQSNLYDSDVIVVPFESYASGALHDSLSRLTGKPLNRTVVCTVDEFWKPESDNDPTFVPMKMSINPKKVTIQAGE